VGPEEELETYGSWSVSRPSHFVGSEERASANREGGIGCREVRERRRKRADGTYGLVFLRCSVGGMTGAAITAPLDVVKVSFFPCLALLRASS
jgi:hypothetical protein